MGLRMFVTNTLQNRPDQIDRVARRGERWHREQAMSEGIQEREKVSRLGFD